ncbi:hypothetical protein BDP27DRAFT_1029915 [Rhodocollybia butyracea]|uniref:Uncharacterized protein n=1 Tax=Rhodocollybia butyracea TaxID=206335 RepID=A0A9P5Q689_9AGAR|nr:hypothetical protein BDP27DRAFT_1029915 [Rhodocollybia butyracea]
MGASDSSGSGRVSLYNATKNGFETTIIVSTAVNSYSYYAVRAIGRAGQVLGASDFVNSTNTATTTTTTTPSDTPSSTSSARSICGQIAFATVSVCVAAFLFL